MRVKVELELEITTDWTEIEGCTKENFFEHVKFVLSDWYLSDNTADIDFISIINKIEKL